MSYEFKATKRFWKSFDKLPTAQQLRAREVFRTFKIDPFAESLGAHMIHKLSADYKKKVFSVTVESDLRAVFVQQGNQIITIDIGNHAIYR